MADIWYDVDTALAEVPVNLMPLIDDTDFKTIEGAVAYNAAGMALYWHFVTSAGAYTLTAVTPTTAGNYDWTDQGAAGIYTIEIPASGGASINNDTEGYGWFTGVATGVLPWRGPVCGFRAAAINDSLCDTNTTGLLAPTVAARTLDVSAGGEAGIDWANIGSPTTAVNLSATNIDTDQVVASVSGAVGSVTGAVGSVTGAVGSVTGAVGSVTGNVGGNVTGSVGSVATGGIVAGSFAADAITAAKLAADVTTELQSGLATAANLATVAGYLDTEIAAILADTNELQTDWANGGRLDLLLDGAASAGDPWTTALPGAYGAGTAGKIVGDNLNATVSSRASQTSVDAVDDLLDTEIAAIKTVVDAILVDTDVIGLAGAGLTALATQASVNTIDDLLDTEVAAIKTVVDAIQVDTDDIQTRLPAALVGGRMDASVGAMAANTLTASALATDAVTELVAATLTTVMTESYAADGAAPTLTQAVLLIQQILTELTIASTTGTIKQLDGTTTAATLTYNDATTPTGVTRAT